MNPAAADPDRPLAALWSGNGDARWAVSGWTSAPRRPAGLPELAETLTSPIPKQGDGPDTRGTGWIGLLSYDLGRALEPAVGPHPPLPHWPLIELHRVEEPTDQAPLPLRPFTLGEVLPEGTRDAYEQSVARAVGYIRAGDCYQVNLAHRLSAPFHGSARALAGALFTTARPWYGAYMESTGHGLRRAVISLSPELFLDFNPATRRVVTRPMKGTRPASVAASDLADSTKDRAELNMIIDLMRNDLGRVCEAGSVRVEDPRAIERHGGERDGGGVWQGVGTVSGSLRQGLAAAELLAATFPPGSVTGCPKIRAMQIINELEPVPRGPYCGCIGWFGDDGRVTLSVAIRTALIVGRPGSGGPDDIVDGRLTYSVGAGITIGSDPAGEWQETLDKAAVLRAAIVP
ncbi:MAG: anthranilate synthase component I family protein [Phycisphaerales bacterium]|nr:anthranilate synthase component I family protein [Phycisphaerales bacterium]